MLIYAVNAKTDTGTDPFLSTGSDLAFVKQVFELTLAADWTAEGRETFARLIEAAAVFPMFRYFRAYDESAGRVAGVLAADNDLSHISLLFVHPDYMKHGVGSKPSGSEVDAPLNYGDYYFLEALLRFRRIK